ncbi:hypothetical protein P8452_31307 [Trifolium repens]|nr:hypothetical protein P8452_31307 [Trifolium repens]
MFWLVLLRRELLLQGRNPQISSSSTPSSMDENIGRGRHGRDSRTHGSARREIPPAPKRPRRKKVQQPETGGSASRTRRSQVDEPVQDDVYDTNQYINQNADWLEQEQPEQAAQQQPPEPEQEPPEVEEENQPDEPQQAQDGVYGGGPTDLSLLSLYHKHRAIVIWNYKSDHKLLKEAMRSIANGKKILNIPKPDGKFVNHEKMRKSEAVDMVTTYLGMAQADVETEFGLFVCSWCAAQYFPTKVLALAYMQQYMDDASDAETSQMAGYLSLVQGWIIEHFPTLGAWSYADNWNETMPRLAKYAAAQG